MMAREPRFGWGGAMLLLLRFALGGVFIYYATPKIVAPDLFAADVFNYHLLPPWGVNALALVLPWLELYTGICVVLGLWNRAAATLMAVMLVVFLVAFTSAKLRGYDIACGCSERGADAKPTGLLSFWVRDGAMLAAALLLARFDRRAPSPLGLLRPKP
jgi:uncharacterized membrane protein YphA (DoxX/SURF4 family)